MPLDIAGSRWLHFWIITHTVKKSSILEIAQRNGFSNYISAALKFERTCCFGKQNNTLETVLKLKTDGLESA